MTKIKMHSNAYREGKVQIFGYTERRDHQTSGDERKNRKELIKSTRKLLETKFYRENLII